MSLPPEPNFTDQEYFNALNTLKEMRRGIAVFQANREVTFTYKDSAGDIKTLSPGDPGPLPGAIGLNGEDPRSPIVLANETYVVRVPFYRKRKAPFKEEYVNLGETILFDYGGEAAALIQDKWVTAEEVKDLPPMVEPDYNQYLHREVIPVYVGRTLFYLVYGKGFTVVPHPPTTSEILAEEGEWFEKKFPQEMQRLLRLGDTPSFEDSATLMGSLRNGLVDPDAEGFFPLKNLVYSDQDGHLMIAHKGGDTFSLGYTSEKFWRRFCDLFFFDLQVQQGRAIEFEEKYLQHKDLREITSKVPPTVHEDEDRYYIVTDRAVIRVTPQDDGQAVVVTLAETYRAEGPEDEEVSSFLPIGSIEHSAVDGGYLHFVINQTFPQVHPKKKYMYCITDMECKNVLYYRYAEEPITSLLVFEENKGEDLNPGLSASGGSLRD